MKSILLENIERLDTVKNIGYKHISVFDPNLTINGSMVFASSNLPYNATNIINNRDLMYERSEDMKDRLLTTIREQELAPLITETFSMLYVTNIMGIYEMVKGLKRGLGTKPARRIIDNVYYKGAFDDINAVVKYLKERNK